MWRAQAVALALCALLATACASSATGSVDPQLVVVDPEVTAQCQATADTLEMAIPCPTVLPEGSRPTVFEGGNCPGRDVWMGPACGSVSNGAFSSIEFSRPSSDVPGHLVIEAVPGAITPPDAVSYPLPATDRIELTERGSMQVAGQTGQVFEVSEESATAFGGHTVVVWSLDGNTYVAGLHGHGGESASLNKSIIEAMAMVRPS